MINGFRNFLKKGDKQYYEVLLYHFLASISNKEEFRKIADWGIFPSSSVKINEDLSDFKEKARILMNGKKQEPIFIRHTATWKGHESWKHGKDRLPCDRHFDTIIIHNRYKNKLKGRVVCIFDDYLTNGTSFETARNLLINEGVAHTYFVSLGKFHKNRVEQYLKQTYALNGDVSVRGYEYRKLSEEWFEGEFNTDAIQEIENLHYIMFGN